jgi:hypothetical protein
MSNVLVGYEDAVDSRITDKVDDYSISKDDVSGSLKELADLALLYPQSNTALTYPKDFITRDAAYNLFIALADDVNGDTTNSANWQLLSSNTSQSVYDLGVISDDFSNGYEASIPSIAAYSTSNIYLFKPDTTNTGASTLQINALSVLPIKKYSSGAIIDVVAGDLDLANTYLLIYKTTYFLIASWASSGGGSGDFASLTGSPYDNTNLATDLNSKQNRINGIVSGCEITVETFVGVGTNKRIRVGDGTWYISPSEYTKGTDTVSSEITLCVTGGDFKYYDVVADNTGVITIHEGTPNTSPAHYTINPLIEVLLGYVLVGDAVIETPTPVVSGFIPYDEKGDEVYYSNTEGFGIGYQQSSGKGSVYFLGGDNVQGVLESNTVDGLNVAKVRTSTESGGQNGIYSEIVSTIRNVATYLTTASFQLVGVALNYAPSVTLASATNPALGATYSNNVTITGTTTIAGFDNVADGITRVVKFTGILQLTYNATTLILPSNANITTAVGDIAVFRSLGSGNWECIEYTRRDGTALVGGSSLTQASQAQVEAAFDNTDQTTPTTLEQTSVLTPFNTWWLVQKIKTFFGTTANQTDSTNKRFVTDAEKVVIGNTSNTNSGNETATTIGALLTTDTTPLDTDLVVSWDGTVLMKTTWTNVKAFLVTYFDTLYLKLTGGTLSGALNYAPTISLTGATPAIGAAGSNNIAITSTTTITAFDTIAEGTIRRVKFSAITTLTHSSNLDLPTSANITTAVGDEAVFRSNGAGSWKCIAFMRKDGTALVGGGSFQTLPVEVTGSLTAAVDKFYVNTATATYTDPTGVQGKGFIVLVRGGTATIGGTAYTVGVVYRYYNSAAWTNIVLRDFATITGDITFAAGVGTIANNAVTNAKAAQMSANTIKANNTGSTANASDVTTDQFTAMMEIATTVATAGILTAITSSTYKYLRLTGCTGLASIVAPSSSYKDLYIWNDTGSTITLYHDYASEATVANRIYCGANRSWANNTMLHLKYSVDEARWCTVAQDGSTFRALLAGTGERVTVVDAAGQETAPYTTQSRDFTPAQQTSADAGSWTGVTYITLTGLKVGQVYHNTSTGFRYECNANDQCTRISEKETTIVTTNLIYPCTEITGTSGTLAEDNAYVLNNASQVVMALPSTATQGKVIVISGKGAGGWKITVPNTQQIVGGVTNTTTAGSGYISAGQYASCTLKCITSGTAAVWEIMSTNPATTLTIA